MEDEAFLYLLTNELTNKIVLMKNPQFSAISKTRIKCFDFPKCVFYAHLKTAHFPTYSFFDKTCLH